MDRRRFLAWLGGTAAGAVAVSTGVLDVDKLLWVPGEKTIFLPEPVELFAEPVELFYGNQLIPIDVFTREVLAIFEKNLLVTQSINREYPTSWPRNGRRVGDVLKVRLPDARLDLEQVVRAVKRKR